MLSSLAKLPIYNMREFKSANGYINTHQSRQLYNKCLFITKSEKPWDFYMILLFQQK